MIKESYINKETVDGVLRMYDVFDSFGHQANYYLSPMFVENGVIYTVREDESYDM